jgi:hypothetical protein
VGCLRIETTARLMEAIAVAGPGDRPFYRLFSFKHAGGRFFIALLVVRAIFDFPVIGVFIVHEIGKAFVETGHIGTEAFICVFVFHGYTPC